MDEIVNAVVFLLENTAVNGVDLIVDGGWHMPVRPIVGPGPPGAATWPNISPRSQRQRFGRLKAPICGHPALRLIVGHELGRMRRASRL